MGAFRIIYALSTIFSLAYCYDYSYTFDVPTILNSFSNMATELLSTTQDLTSLRTSQDSDADADSDVKGPTLRRTLEKVTFDVAGYMATMLNSLSRRTPVVKERKPNVEMGPGSYKTEQVTYPPNFFVKRLKMLLVHQKEQDEKKKPITESKN